MILLDLHRVDEPFVAEGGGDRLGQPARPAAEVRDHLAGSHVEHLDHIGGLRATLSCLGAPAEQGRHVQPMIAASNLQLESITGSMAADRIAEPT